MMSSEHEHPPREKPADDNSYFEKLTQAVFQTGFSWKVVRNKWPNFQKAFEGFDIDTIAAYDERDVDRLLADEGIIRNGRKTLSDAFRYFGPTGVYFFLWSVGEDVPPWEERDR
jgi:3-methyladenine DNA glycosylase Tag